MNVAGFDCSTKSIACVILDENRKLINKYFIENRAKTIEERLWVLARILDVNAISIFFINKVDLSVVENAIHIQNAKSAIGIAQVIGYVKGLSAKYSVPFIGVDNKSWKKDVLGNGNASKDIIMEFAINNWGKENISNQDLADASCIALFGVLRKI